MTLSAYPEGDQPASGGSQSEPEAPPAPLKWSVTNWPLRWKVIAIALVPTLLAIIFAGLHVSGEFTEARQLRRTADQATVIPAITDYLAALGGALVAASADGDVQSATKRYDYRKHELASQLAKAGAADDVRSAVSTLTEGGQALLDGVLSDEIGLRDQVTAYAPILLVAEDAITASVRVDDERIRAEVAGLSRAVGARGQMAMQEMLISRGGELPGPELRTAMTTVAGTEPSTLFGMNPVLGADSPDAKRLQQQMVTRMAIIADPETVLPSHPGLRDSIRSTDEIASRVIGDTTRSVTESLQHRAADRRDAALREAVLILAAVLLALVLVWLAARSLVRSSRGLRTGAHGDDAAASQQLTTEVFEAVARRNRSLVDQQLALIEALERGESDTDRLASLFRLDQLAVRMRRNSANLLVLAGAHVSPERGRPTPLSMVISAAIAEVEDYQRVRTPPIVDAAVSGAATSDTVQLVAELIDNALRYSPPATPVLVSAVASPHGGVVIKIVDSGLGMTEEDLRIANTRLAACGDITARSARHMGLLAVGRLAHRHGIAVRLVAAPSPIRGIIAEVHLPADLLANHSQDRPAAAAPASQPPAGDRNSSAAASTAYDVGRSTNSIESPPTAGVESSPTAGEVADLIYQRMRSEWLDDPHELGRSTDLDWKSVWDHGWTVAAEAENVAAVSRTEHGLPVREAGARLVPGSVEPDPAVASRGRAASPRADTPEAIRDSLSGHFGGVRAGRTAARDQAP